MRAVIIVIAGTGTEIGKTYVACSLLRAYREAGVRCCGLKPVESGGDADARKLEEAAEFHVKPKAPYQFQDPVSPHLAARREQRAISLSTCGSWIAQAAADAERVVVELPGALLSPLGSGITNASLLRALAPDAWVLVAPDRLGVLHDVTVALLAVRHLGLAQPVVVLSAPGKADSSTGTNARELADLGICEPCAWFGRHASTSLETRAAARHLACKLG